MVNPTVVLRLGLGWGFDNEDKLAKDTLKLREELTNSLHQQLLMFDLKKKIN